MLEKSRHETFFSMASARTRPTSGYQSVHTEFMETDWEMEDDYSEIEDLDGLEDGESSPRISVGSVGPPRLPKMSVTGLTHARTRTVGTT
jgi:hypothetical protein